MCVTAYLSISNTTEERSSIARIGKVSTATHEFSQLTDRATSDSVDLLRTDIDI